MKHSKTIDYQRRAQMLTLFMLLLLNYPVWAQNTTVNINGVHHKGKVLLRWAPTDAASWMQQLQAGYQLNRYTLYLPGSQTPVANVESTKVVLRNMVKHGSEALFEDILRKDSLAVTGNGTPAYVPNPGNLPLNWEPQQQVVVNELFTDNNIATWSKLRNTTNITGSTGALSLLAGSSTSTNSVRPAVRRSFAPLCGDVKVSLSITPQKNLISIPIAFRAKNGRLIALLTAGNLSSRSLVVVNDTASYNHSMNTNYNPSNVNPVGSSGSTNGYFGDGSTTNKHSNSANQKHVIEVIFHTHTKTFDVSILKASPNAYELSTYPLVNGMALVGSETGFPFESDNADVSSVDIWNNYTSAGGTLRVDDVTIAGIPIPAGTISLWRKSGSTGSVMLPPCFSYTIQQLALSPTARIVAGAPAAGVVQATGLNDDVFSLSVGDTTGLITYTIVPSVGGTTYPAFTIKLELEPPVDEGAILFEPDPPFMAGVAAGSLFEADPIVENPDTGLLKTIRGTSDLENRFGLLMLACDARFDVAMASGLGFIDTSVLAGYTYIYELLPAGAVAGTPGAVVQVAVQGTTSLAVVDTPLVENGDKSTRLIWYGHDDYSGYKVECSSDNGATWSDRSKGMVVPVQEEENDRPIAYFADILEQNDVKYLYRLTGRSPFGIYGPPSAPVEVMGKKARPQAPFVYLVTRTPADSAQTTATLTWSQLHSDRVGQAGYRVMRSVGRDAPYVPISGLLPLTDSLYVDTNPPGYAYYRVDIRMTDGDSSCSVALLWQKADKTPPASPTGLKATMDNIGKTVVMWNENKEEDLKGYQLYAADSRRDTFILLSGHLISATRYETILPATSLRDTIYFCLKAVDQRDNVSLPTAPYALPVVDLKAPNTGLISLIEPASRGMRIHCQPSSSTDVVKHTLQRRQSFERDWENVYESDTMSAGFVFLDTTLTGAYTWEYRYCATDDAGLISYSIMQSVKSGNTIRPDIGFTSVEITGSNRGYASKLTWTYIDDPAVNAFLVYRNKAGEPPVLYWTVFTNDLQPGAAEAGILLYSWNDEEVKAGNTYEYSLVARFADGGASPMTTPKTVTF